MSSRQIPLSVWQRPASDEKASIFTLPGTDELLSFSGLWAEDPTEPADQQPDSDSIQIPLLDTSPAGAGSDISMVQFHTPGLLPDETDDTLTFTCQLPSPESGDRTILYIPPLLGKGNLSLNGNHLLSFCSFPGSISDELLSAGKNIDLTDILLPDQKNELQLCFEPFRPAGICSLFSLHTCSGAQLSFTAASRSRLEAQCTFTVSAFVPGRYSLRITSITGNEQIAEAPLSFNNCCEQTADCVIALSGKSAGYFRAALFRIDSPGDGDTLCDALTILVGTAPKPGKAVLPVPAEDSVLYPPDFIRFLQQIGSPSVYTAVPLSESCISALYDEQIPLCLPRELQKQVPAALQVNPNVCFMDPPPMLSSGAASAWQLCGLLAIPRPVPPDMPVSLLLQDIFGLQDFSNTDRLPLRLAELHLLHVRLHAELVRQSMGYGALCANGEWDDPLIAEILSSVFKPCHLSIAPIQGAWFAGSELVFSSRTFFGSSCPDPNGIQAEFTLIEQMKESAEDISSHASVINQILYKEVFPASQLTQKNIMQRVLLPDHTSCLMLCGRLRGPDGVFDTTVVPVFVGTHAVLEAALSYKLPFCPPDFTLLDQDVLPVSL